MALLRLLAWAAYSAACLVFLPGSPLIRTDLSVFMAIPSEGCDGPKVGARTCDHA
jgi:hypothetical protein